MVILSFSVKEAELKSGVKVRTTRRYTPEKWALWKRTMDGGDLMLDCWWKSRRPEGYKLFERQGSDLYRLRFLRDSREPYRLYPMIETEPMSGIFSTPALSVVGQYAREEGFGGSTEQFWELMAFFDQHYEHVESVIFQSIAFSEVD
jgi:hypothetical protein